MSAADVVIVSAKRTPIGAFLGALSPLTGVQLGSAAAQAAVQASGLAPGDIQEVIMGCVLSANLRSGSVDTVLAGGLESMSNAPYLLAKARSGYRMGPGEIIDHMMRDGLQSPFDGKSMGCFADSTATRYNFTRAQQDAFATESVRRAMAALQGGEFDAEVTPLTIKGRKGDTVIARDETPGTCDVSKIATMKPAFNKDGTVTAASSSSISDGAAALVLMRAETAAARGVKPIARVLAWASHAQEPEWFTTAPVGAIRKVLTQLGWKPHDADLYEINEAFAVVTMAAMRDIDIDHARVNVSGGACALGHPIGATGARILTTLLYALRRRAAKRGIASLCIGGGEAVALAVEITK
jgi:acetyl-CoA C-acetyltransferase